VVIESSVRQWKRVKNSFTSVLNSIFHISVQKDVYLACRNKTLRWGFSFGLVRFGRDLASVVGFFCF
jgi:hypothetical protein